MAEWAITYTPAESASTLQFAGNESSTGLRVLERTVGSPELRAAEAQSFDGDGDARISTSYGNRQISYTILVRGDTAASLYGRQHNLMKMVEQAKRSGGTLVETPKSGTATLTYDVEGAELGEVSTDHFPDARQAHRVTFTVRPYGRLTTVSVTPVSLSGDPLLIYNLSNITGDSYALGQLTLQDTAAQKRRWICWGLEGRHLDLATSLFIEAEAMTMLNGTTAVVGPAGAHGGANKAAERLNVGTSWTWLASTGSGGLAHNGLFRVMCRARAPAANASDISLRFDWSIGGQFNTYQINAAKTLAKDSAWHILDLGLVTIPVAPSPPQHWEGRIAAKALNATDDLSIDWLALIPAEQGFGQVGSAAAAAGAVLHPSRTMTIEHEGAFMQSSGGSVWGHVNTRLGDPLLIPPGTSRLAILHSRGDQLRAEADTSSTDSINAALDVIPRQLYLPAS